MMAYHRVVNDNSIEYDGNCDSEIAMAQKVDWTEKTKGLLKGELKRRGITYAGLVEKLGKLGVEETEPNIRNKIARGGFTAAFLVQCLTAIGCQTLRLDDA